MYYKFFAAFLPCFVICNCIVSYDFDIKGNSQNGYYILAAIGTPPQSVNLLVDTGSSNLAIASTRYRIKDSQFWVYNESSTFHPFKVGVRLRYVHGDWSGFLALDVFNPCLPQNCSIICNISVMTSMRDIFDDDSEFQGILGLAYSSIANPSPSVRPILDVFIQENNVDNLFSLSLCGPFFSSPENSTTCGKFHVGISQENAQSNILYTPIVREWFYEVTVIDLKVGNNSVPKKCHELNENMSIIDSGNSDLNVPPEVYAWMISQIRNHLSTIHNNFQMNETVVCMDSKYINASLFPNLTISLYHSKNSLFNIHISPELYVLPSPSHTGTCIKLGIGISNYGVVVGSTILKGFYVVFDRKNKQVGFSKLNIASQSIFISDISKLFVYEIDFDHCIRTTLPAESNISPIVILGLIGVCVIAVLFLYALLSWIWKIHVTGRDNSSDTSSLVDDD